MIQLLDMQKIKTVSEAIPLTSSAGCPCLLGLPPGQQYGSLLEP